MSADNGAYFALALVLTALCGVLTWLAYRSRGVPSLITGAGITLVPLALWLTSTLRLVADIVDAIGNWATGLVFSPRVWVGLIVAAVAVVLIVAGTALRRRGLGGKAPAAEVEAGGSVARVGASPAGRQSKSARSAPSGRPAKAGKTAKGSSGDPELDDIEALLRKHGIS